MINRREVMRKTPKGRNQNNLDKFNGLSGRTPELTQALGCRSLSAQERKQYTEKKITALIEKANANAKHMYGAMKIRAQREDGI